MDIKLYMTTFLGANYHIDLTFRDCVVIV